MLKKTSSILAVLTTVAFLTTASACTGETPYGECVGITDEGRADTHYRLSGWNLGVSILFFGTIIVPVLWATDYAKCPTSRKLETNDTEGGDQ